MVTFLKQFPQQKLAMSKKTEEWGIECIESALSIVTHDTSKIRKSKANKKLNFDLANGIIDETDIERAFNPMGIRGVQFPAKIQNYPIEQSKFNVLKGEEAKRRFDWRVRVVNEMQYPVRKNSSESRYLILSYQNFRTLNTTKKKQQGDLNS